MIKKLIATTCLFVVSSMAHAATPSFYYISLVEDGPGTDFDYASGIIDSLTVCDYGLCGSFQIGIEYTPIFFRGLAYNVNFSGLLPTGFVGSAHQFDVSPTFVAGYGPGQRFVTANFEVIGNRFSFDYDDYVIAGNYRYDFSRGAGVGQLWFSSPITTPVPESESYALMLMGAPLLALARRRMARKQPDRYHEPRTLGMLRKLVSILFEACARSSIPD